MRHATPRASLSICPLSFPFFLFNLKLQKIRNKLRKKKTENFGIYVSILGYVKSTNLLDYHLFVLMAAIFDLTKVALSCYMVVTGEAVPPFLSTRGTG